MERNPYGEKPKPISTRIKINKLFTNIKLKTMERVPEAVGSENKTPSKKWDEADRIWERTKEYCRECRSMASEKRMTVKLFCPSLSKVVSYVVREDQRLDLGSIARTFGLDPWSVKLNGHFISRGRDFISSSLTWNSLLSFFSSRSLPTGAVDANPLVVDGKLCRPGTKSTWLYALFFLFYSVFGCPENGGKRNGTHLKLYFFLLFFSF